MLLSTCAHSSLLFRGLGFFEGFVSPVRSTLDISLMRLQSTAHHSEIWVSYVVDSVCCHISLSWSVHYTHSPSRFTSRITVISCDFWTEHTHTCPHCSHLISCFVSPMLPRVSPAASSQHVCVHHILAHFCRPLPSHRQLLFDPPSPSPADRCHIISCCEAGTPMPHT